MKKWTSLTAVVLACFASVAQGVTITGNSGPGGFYLTDGTSPLIAWFKADAITGVTDNTTFGTWVESSNTAGVSSSSAGSNPTYHATQAGLNPAGGYEASVQFQGSNFLNLNGVSSLPTGTVIGVAAPSDDRYLLQHSTNRQIRMRQSSGNNIAAYNGGSNPLSTATTTSAGDFLIGEWLGGATSISFYENGVSRGTGSLAGGPGGLSDNGYNRIGVQSIAGPEIFISEVAVFNTVLNSAERQIVENALSAKWNQTMLANNRYSGDDLAQGDNDRDVFGIGRVDNSNEVTSAGAAGFGIEATAGLDDNEWILAGHNDPVNGLTSDGVLNETQRWTRAWYVEQTGSIDTNLTFDWGDAGLGAFQAAYDRLLYSADGINFDPFSTNFIIDGDQISFLVAGAELANGFYTIGTTPIPEPGTFGLLGCALLVMSLRRRQQRKTAKASSVRPAL